ncbi:MAG: hypothetical protein K2L45_03235 [Muribaculaceae bacterium]|nr:hypothetical protein [Muribaculaceae bacterium]
MCAHGGRQVDDLEVEPGMIAVGLLECLQDQGSPLPDAGDGRVGGIFLSHFGGV